MAVGVNSYNLALALFDMFVKFPPLKVGRVNAVQRQVGTDEFSQKNVIPSVRHGVKEISPTKIMP